MPGTCIRLCPRNAQKTTVCPILNFTLFPYKALWTINHLNRGLYNSAQSFVNLYIILIIKCAIVLTATVHVLIYSIYSLLHLLTVLVYYWPTVHVYVTVLLSFYSINWQLSDSEQVLMVLQINMTDRATGLYWQYVYCWVRQRRNLHRLVCEQCRLM